MQSCQQQERKTEPSPRRSPEISSPAAMETLASAMRREHRRSKQASASSSAGAAGRVPLVMTFLSCLACLYVAGRYPPQIPTARLRRPSPGTPSVFSDPSIASVAGCGRTHRPGRSCPASSTGIPATCGSLLPFISFPPARHFCWYVTL
jgi:hypothetical protein